MRRLNDSRPLLPTPSEARLLKILWKLGASTVEQIVNSFPEGDRPNYKTTHSFLRIMEAKGFVTHTVLGKAFVFRPLISEEHVARATVDTVLRQSFDGSVTGLMVNLLEAGKVRPAELQELEDLIQDYRRKHRLGE